MAFENLFIRTKKSLGGIELDAVLSETHNNQVTLTKNPVEFGVNITDHAYVEPKKINIVAQVSDTPLGAAAFGQIVDLITGLFGTATIANITRSAAAYEAMVQLMEAREPLIVQTKLKQYTNMVIVALSAPQDKDTSRVVRMTIALEEVIISESKLIQIDPAQLAQGTTREQGSPAENRGREETIIPPAKTEQSVLKSVIDWVD